MEKLPNRTEETLFVCVGRLAEQKGFDRLLISCSELNKEDFKYQVWIVGEGEDREKLEKYIEEHNLRNVHLLGQKSNPYKYMKRADWFLMPSRHEGFALVSMEAVWCGTPILTTRNAGANELLGDSEYGIIIENSQKDITDGMRRVLNHPELCEYYREKSKERKQFIDIEVRINKIRELID